MYVHVYKVESSIYKLDIFRIQVFYTLKVGFLIPYNR